MNEFENNQNLNGMQMPEQSEQMPENPVREPEQTYQAAAQTDGAYHYAGSAVPEGGGYSANPYGGQGGYQSAPQNPYQNQTPGYGAQPPQYPGNNNPMAAYNVEPPQKKQSGGAKIVAIALACVLVGGIGGGLGVHTYLNRNVVPSASAEESAMESAPTASAEPEETAPAFNNMVIDVTTNSSATSMTPQNVYEEYVNAVVAISNESTTNIFGQQATTASSGSGFIISKDGYIVTNNHVVENAQTLTVMMTSGEEYEAHLIGADAENDVALIKIEGEDFPTVSIGDSNDIQVGQQVCAIGNPLGELTNTMTVGYVSALDREINENGTPINMFQTDCAINSGNSGGPIFDMHGNVVGITTAKYSSNGYSSSASIEGIGFCIPVNDAMDIVGDLLQYGYVKGRPALGISCRAISSTVTQYYRLPSGIGVEVVEEGSAAANAGIQEGDIITAVDGTEVTSVTDFKTLLKKYSAGDTAVLSIYRGAEDGTLELEVTFDEKSAQVQNASEQQQEAQNSWSQVIPQIPGIFG